MKVKIKASIVLLVDVDSEEEMLMVADNAEATLKVWVAEHSSDLLFAAPKARIIDYRLKTKFKKECL